MFKKLEKKLATYGIQKRKQSDIHQNAQKMLQRGYPIEEIAEITGLSPEEIASLKDEDEG